jgi:hypothetical protein
MQSLLDDAECVTPLNRGGGSFYQSRLIGCAECDTRFERRVIPANDIGGKYCLISARRDAQEVNNGHLAFVGFTKPVIVGRIGVLAMNA